ncbi:MAG: hypothetical protein QF662_06860, partial [Phycisphaerae bacterium]|nr:hypothetical protein [Phycisphaerae bacterium]
RGRGANEFAILNCDLAKKRAKPKPREALNKYYKGRGLACIGFGRGPKATQLYMLGTDRHLGHRHPAAMTLLMYASGKEILT